MRSVRPHAGVMRITLSLALCLFACGQTDSPVQPDAGPGQADAAADAMGPAGPDARWYDAAPAPAVAFEKGDQYVFVGDEFTNAATLGKAHPGANLVVQYTSSDDGIATVDQSGNVTAVASGYATITVTVTSKHATQTSASYNTLVNFVVNAWVGANDTELTFTDGATGANMYRSSAVGCDIANWASCPDGQHDTLQSGQTYVDTAFNTTRPGYYTYEVDGVTHSLPMSSTRQPGAGHHGVAVFNDKLFIVGGYRNGGYSAAVHSSADGINWIEETSDAGFTPRMAHGLAVFDGKLWVVGGTGTGDYGDVWWSADGATWTRATDAPGFTPRYASAVFAFNGKLWLIGGWDNTDTERNDIWSTSNGTTWTREVETAPFSARNFHQVTEMNGTLYLLGTSSDSNDVWTSSDATNWTQVSTGAGFPARVHNGFVAFEDKLWVVAGWGDSIGGRLSDVWSSPDGVTWTQELDTPPFQKREYARLVTFDNRMWMVGGVDESFLQDTWSTLDGLTWINETTEAGFVSRAWHGTVSFDNKLWVIAGWAGTDLVNDIWSSADGITWTQETAAAQFTGRAGAGVFVHDSKLWVVGGIDSTFESKNDVWSSSDGVTWTEVSSAAPFTGRAFHAAASFNGRMYVIGGSAGSTAYADMWSSADGITWIQEADPPWGARNGAGIVVYDNKMWHVGGAVVGAGNRNDVWYHDGTTGWNLVTNAGGFPARSFFVLLASNDRLYVVGGDAGGGSNDVWSSAHGLAWIEATPSAAFSGRDGLGGTFHNGKLMITAGNGLGSDNAGDVWASTDGATWRRGHRTVISF